MPLRPLVVSFLLFIFIIIGIYEVYQHVHVQHRAYQIDTNQKWIGVIDLSADHDIDMAGVIRSEDALLVLDYTNPLFLQLIQNTTGLTAEEALKQFDLENYDSNNDGVLNQEDPIFHYLKLLVFDTDGNGYFIRTLPEAGIRGIRVKHVDERHKHQAVMSDGTTRSVYEINQPGGTSIYKTSSGKVVTELP